jgi:exopolysaccharide biosynthesis protein
VITGNGSHKRGVFARYQQAFVCQLLVLVFATWSSIPERAYSQRSTSPFTSNLSFAEVAPGIEHGQVTIDGVTSDGAAGPLFINVLRVDLRRARLKIVRALDQGLGLETVSSLAARHRAVAAINGGYFRTTGTYRGESTGFLLIDGKLISEPYNGRADFGLINEGPATDVIFGHLKYLGEISAGPAKHLVQGLNRPVSLNEMIVFTPEFHRTTLTNPDGVEVVVRRNRVVAVKDLTGSTKIPPDGFVISAVGTARDWTKRNVRKGERLRFSWSMNSAEAGRDSQWRRAHSILGAGPQLIKSGKVAITHLEEKMAPSFASDRHPRTAVGRTRDGKLILVAVDGRQPQISIGMSLYTLADLLLNLGAVEAINLDGGGSTTMVVKQEVVNKPSDQTGERPVSDAILVFPLAK